MSSLTPHQPDRANEGLTDLEQSLGRLTPTSRLNRDQTLFRAGMAAAQYAPRRSPFWPALAASLAVLCLGQGVLLARRPAPEAEVVHLPATQEIKPEAVVTLAPPSTITARAVAPLAATPQRWSDAPGPTAADRLNWQIIRYGLDALPATPVAFLAPTEEPLTAGQNYRNDVRKLLNPGGPS